MTRGKINMVAKKNKSAWEEKWMANNWFLLGWAVVFLAIAYGFASLAINYAGLWQYILAIVFLYLAFKEFKRIVLNLVHK